MVRREKSPEINEDIILFVAWIPYPLNPNWVYEQDVQDCAKWVAEVINNEYYLISIHQKPSVDSLLFPFTTYLFVLFQSRGMILLEISKEFTDHGRLLGEHQWRHFLKDPNKDEEGHKTCVYYSVYRTCRDARKEGTHTTSLSHPSSPYTQVGILSRHLRNGSRAGHPEQGKHISSSNT